MRKEMILSALCVLISASSFSQVLKQKTESLYNEKRQLTRQTNEYYNSEGMIIKKVSTDFADNDKSIVEYYYDENYLLVKEVLSGLRSYKDDAGKIHWLDTSLISIETYQYDSLDRIKIMKNYNFQCNLDTCDIDEYFYLADGLVRKFCMNDCSMAGKGYNYPVYSTYDVLGQKIQEQAFGPQDTTMVWYTHVFPVDSISYVDLRYYRSGLLKTQTDTDLQPGRATSKFQYTYNKKGELKRMRRYETNFEKGGRFELYYYQTWSYIYH